ncbi:MAG: S-methyl-5-thioribose-1-phosphate isomerase, partial [Candidatus Omnitrophota bacterium]
NPAFDVTPAGLISGIITERGLIRPVSKGNIRKIIGT